jgi:hypothetical protein
MNLPACGILSKPQTGKTAFRICHLLLGVVHAQVVCAGKIALAPPDFEKNMVAFDLLAKFDGIVGIGTRLAVDLHDDVAALKPGLRGI